MNPWERATSALRAPLVAVDLDAFDANADDLVRRAGGLPIRVASKSVRCRALLDRVLARPGFSGVMAYAVPEAVWLAPSALKIACAVQLSMPDPPSVPVNVTVTSALYQP